MQTTLLGLAIAIILALVAALVAPLVVDWNHYRTAIESEASRLTGLSVRVNGTIDARLLPSPAITLRDVEIGPPGHEQQVRAGMVKLELALGALLRGQVEASEAHIIAPQISLALDRSGAVEWPAPPASFRPPTLSISRLNIEDGRLTLSDAVSGTRIVLHKLWFSGDVRSIVGPFSGEGAVVVGDELYGYRISGSRVEGAGGIKIRLGIDPADHPLTSAFDGTLTFDHGVPQFEGTLALARPAGATLANGQRVMSEPWHARGTVRATPAAASVQDFTFQYGPEERAANFTGSAELRFGPQPYFTAALSALQLDIDRALADPDVTNRPPLVAVRSFLQAFVATAKLPMPGQIGISVDALTVGGTTIQSLHGDLRFATGGWSLSRLQFRAPGLTQVNLSGRLVDTPQGFAFTGPATLEAADAGMLVAWLKGRGTPSADQAVGLTARGEVTIASDRIAIEQLTAALGQETVSGRLAYSWPADDRPAALDAELRAQQLDLDALTAFADNALGADGLALPQQGTLALDVGAATFAGVDARAVKAQVKFDAGKLHIDRLSVGDLGGAKLDVSGRIDELSSRPRGQLTLNLDARALTGLSDILARYAPQQATILRRFADRLAPAKVRAVLTLEQATQGSTAKLQLDGSLAAMHVAVGGDASGEPSQLGSAVLHIDGRLDSDAGAALVALLGLDRAIAVDMLPGRLTFSLIGPLNGPLDVDARLSAGGLDAGAHGGLRLSGEGPAAALQVFVKAADLRPLRQSMVGQAGPAFAASAQASLTIAGTRWSFTDIAAAAGQAAIRGRLALDFAGPLGIDGALEADTVDAAAVTAMLLGMPSAAPSAAFWSSEPTAAGAFGAVNGAVSFKLGQAVFTPVLVAHKLTGVIRFRPSEITVGDLDGGLAGGRVGGAATFHRDANGLSAHWRIELVGANAATIIGPSIGLADGLVSTTLQGDGVGRTPLELVRALHGSGTVSFTDAHFAGLDVAAFDAAIRAADQAGTIDAAKIEAAVSAAMANGRLAVPQGVAAVTMASGAFNLARVALQAQGDAALSFDGVVDLANASLDMRMTMSERPPSHALIQTRPELAITLKGPLAAPRRTLDVSALVSWLTLRAAELQTRRLHSIEANRRDALVGPVERPDAPPPHLIAPGAVVDMTLPATGALGLVPGARGLDRLQPTSPPALPDQGRVSPGSAPRGAAPATLPPPMVIRPIAPRPLPRVDDGTASAGSAQRDQH